MMRSTIRVYDRKDIEIVVIDEGFNLSVCCVVAEQVERKIFDYLFHFFG